MAKEKKYVMRQGDKDLCAIADDFIRLHPNGRPRVIYFDREQIERWLNIIELGRRPVVPGKFDKDLYDGIPIKQV